MAMATTRDTRIFLELPETDQSGAKACLRKVIIDSGEREHEGEEPSQEGMSRPHEAVDFEEMPLGGAVSPPCSSDGGLQRLWEGGLFDMSDLSDDALHTVCCPWHTFGTNMERSGFGTSRGQGGIILLLVMGALCFYIMFACTGSPWYIYGSVSQILVIGIYGGHYRARIRRRFNIIGSEGDDTVSTVDDHLYHLMCGCCSLCQEARTLKHNNVHSGVWHGRGDILVIGSQVVFSPKAAADLALHGPMTQPSWRKTSSKMETCAETLSMEPGVDHAWTGQVSQMQQLPLLKR